MHQNKVNAFRSIHSEFEMHGALLPQHQSSFVHGDKRSYFGAQEGYFGQKRAQKSLQTPKCGAVVSSIRIRMRVTHFKNVCDAFDHQIENICLFLDHF